MSRDKEYKKFYFNYVVEVDNREVSLSQYGDNFTNAKKMLEEKKDFVEKYWDDAEVKSDIREVEEFQDLENSDRRYQFNFDLGTNKGKSKIVSLSESDNYEADELNRIWFEQMGSDKNELRQKAKILSQLDYVVLVTEVMDRSTDESTEDAIKKKRKEFYQS